ncbi:MAG: HypC/HybG/HupF family hydrogenase formation chaperone [Planctomycetota bacterium]
MCLAVPGKIIETRHQRALVDFQGNRMEVCTVLTPDADVHDWVLVHAGFAIAKIEEGAAKETWSYLSALAAEE